MKDSSAGAVDRALVEVELVEDARPRAAGRGDRGAIASMSTRIPAASAAPLAALAGRGRDELDVGEHRGDVRGVDDEHRDPEGPELRERLGAVEAVAAGEDEVGLEADDLLDVDRPLGHDAGDLRGLGGMIIGIRGADHARAGAHREEDLGRGRRQRDDALWPGRQRHRRLLVVGEGHRVGRRDGRGRGSGGCRRSRGGGGDERPGRRRAHRRRWRGRRAARHHEDGQDGDERRDRDTGLPARARRDGTLTASGTSLSRSVGDGRAGARRRTRGPR